jgi:hypothetical protein
MLVLAAAAVAGCLIPRNQETNQCILQRVLTPLLSALEEPAMVPQPQVDRVQVRGWVTFTV